MPCLRVWRATGHLPQRGSARSAARRAIGVSTRKTARQPNASAINPEMAGPINPGTTQPVDIRASMRGLAAAGNPRPTATYADEIDAPAAKSLQGPAEDEDLHGGRETTQQQPG